MPVYTVALGTDDGTVEVPDGYGGIQTIRVPPDPATLAQVAEKTGGTFFEAADGDALQGVYDEIGSQVGVERSSASSRSSSPPPARSCCCSAGRSRRSGSGDSRDSSGPVPRETREEVMDMDATTSKFGSRALLAVVAALLAAAAIWATVGLAAGGGSSSSSDGATSGGDLAVYIQAQEDAPPASGDDCPADGGSGQDDGSGGDSGSSGTSTGDL